MPVLGLVAEKLLVGAVGMSHATAAEPNKVLSHAPQSSAWPDRVARAVQLVGTPCHVGAWAPIQESLDRLDALQGAARVWVRPWLSMKTQPLPQLAAQWRRSGRGVEVVSEVELLAATVLGFDADHLLVNGVAKHTWLGRHPIHRLRVHFDSLPELRHLLPLALSHEWRVGIRCHAPTECDARDPRFGGQFGLDRREAVIAILELQAAGADLQGIHFHLGQRAQAPDAYVRAVEHVGGVCAETGFAPSILDLGGGLPTAAEPSHAEALAGLETAIHVAAKLFPTLQEVWLENGRFISERSAVLAVRVLDVKERPECRYLICDGGRTNHALAADVHTHPTFVIPPRSGPSRLTTVCGPTCMTDDRLGRWRLPESVAAGDVIVWCDAGAYHLPWETRFSHGLCAVVWCDEDEQLTIAREREEPRAWMRQWTVRS